jgi:hypothetical protein
MLADYLELKRQVMVELLEACCQRASEEELERVQSACFLLGDAVCWELKRPRWLSMEWPRSWAHSGWSMRWRLQPLSPRRRLLRELNPLPNPCKQEGGVLLPRLLPRCLTLSFNTLLGRVAK